MKKSFIAKATLLATTVVAIAAWTYANTYKLPEPPHSISPKIKPTLKRRQIEYRGGKYPIREAKNSFGETVTFSSNSLLRVIFPNGEYYSRIAKRLDERIYAYVPDEVIETYSDEEFQKYIDENYD